MLLELGNLNMYFLNSCLCALWGVSLTLDRRLLVQCLACTRWALNGNAALTPAGDTMQPREHPSGSSPRPGVTSTLPVQMPAL